MKFYKYHGTGNDFIIIDNRRGTVGEEVKPELSLRLCNRHFGVGGDGVIFVEESAEADAQMRIFNPDGSEAEMCGNGIRCMAVFLRDSGLKKNRIRIETLAGLLEITLAFDSGGAALLTVDMGSPSGVVLNSELEVDGDLLTYSYADIGVPHAVFFVPDVEAVEIMKIAPLIRHNPVFPRGVNVNFVQQISKRTFKIRTFERGVEGETLACGTGITAAGALAVYTGRARGGVELEFQARGGTVYVRVDKEKGADRLFMTGPAVFVFEGVVADSLL
ncbi:MAG: diaminopimelate epimerase [Candidatus Hydrothermarchaeales archaeon]